MTLEQIISDTIFHGTQILNGEDSRSAGISLTERMNLPQAGDETADMPNLTK